MVDRWSTNIIREKYKNTASLSTDELRTSDTESVVQAVLQMQYAMQCSKNIMLMLD